MSIFALASYLTWRLAVTLPGRRLEVSNSGLDADRFPRRYRCLASSQRRRSRCGTSTVRRRRQYRPFRRICAWLRVDPNVQRAREVIAPTIALTACALEPAPRDLGPRRRRSSVGCRDVRGVGNATTCAGRCTTTHMGRQHELRPGPDCRRERGRHQVELTSSPCS